MDMFNLPYSTKVNSVIPKNTFDKYTTGKQKKLFTELVFRITWVNKLSSDTVNLPFQEIMEIQVIKLELKKKIEIQPVLNIIDKVSPYFIIFIIEHDGSVYLSTSVKHAHPVNENNAVIDWTFKSDWFNPEITTIGFNLKISLDAVYRDFCIQIAQLTGMATKTLSELVEYNVKLDQLQKEILKLKTGIKTATQFNKKVELNMALKRKEEELARLYTENNKEGK